MPARSPRDALAVQHDIEQHLKQRWGLAIGADSKEILICKGWRGRTQALHGWQVQEDMKMLGHWLSHDGGYRKCFEETTAAMLRSFYGNLNAGLKRANYRCKRNFMRTCVLPIAKSRWARWAYLSTNADKLNSLQRKMISVLHGIVPRPEEAYDAFCLRRRREAHAIAKDTGLWSFEWAKSIVSWAAHVDREHDAMTWSKHLLAWHGPEWLNLQRLLWSRPGMCATNTRCMPGAPSKRWQDGLASAKQIAGNH